MKLSTLRVAAQAFSLTDEAFPEAEPVFAQGYEGEFRTTALVIEAETRLAIISVDALIVPFPTIQAARQRIAQETAIAEENVVICATHTHSGPPTLDFFGSTPHKEYLRRIEEGCVAAVREACAWLEGPERVWTETQAELLFGLSQEATMGRNSRLLLQDGQIGWYGYAQEDVVRPTGPYDPDIPVLAFRRAEGHWAALMFSHNVHNIGGIKPDIYSPAFSGLARQELEKRYQTTALFVPGAFGSTHHLTYEGSGLPIPEVVGRLVAAVEEGLQKAKPCLFGPVRLIQRPFSYQIREFEEAQAEEAVRRYVERYLPQQADYWLQIFRHERAEMAPVQGETRQTTLTAIRLGDVAFVGIPGELFARLSLQLRERSPFRHTFVIGLANEEIGYIPDRQAYADGGYQTWPGWQCRVAPGTGEAMIEQALEMLEELFYEGQPLLVVPILRRLRREDALALQHFYNTTSAQVRYWFNPLGWNASWQQCEEICEQSARGERYDIVLEDGRQIVGWGFLTHLDKPLAYLGIGITDSYCDRGLGKKLMAALVQEAKKRGHQGIELIFVQDNTRARALYEHFGFQVQEPFTAPDGRGFYKAILRFSENG